MGFLGLLWKFRDLIGIGLIALTIAFFVYDYKHTKAALATAQQTISQQAGEIKGLQADMDTYKTNNGRLSVLSSRTARLAQEQETLKEKMDSVPANESVHPFDDPGLLARAGILRDHQNAVSQQQPSGHDSDKP